MNHVRATVSTLVLIPAFISITWAASENPGSIRDDSNWKSRMQSLLQDVGSLIPFAFQTGPGENNRNEILGSLKRLESNSVALSAHTKRGQIGDSDPSFRFIAVTFENEVSQARTLFETSQNNSKTTNEEARRHMRTAISKCMSCHTQSSVGPSLNLDRFKNQIEQLPPASRILAYAATRQFDSALETFSAMVDQAQVHKPSPGVFDSSAKIAVSILVRVNKDPKRAIALVDKIQSSGAGSAILRGSLVGWKNDLLEWRSKPAISSEKPFDSVLFQEATRLRTSTMSSESGLESYRSFDIRLLRASSLLHDLLANYPKSSLRAKTYLELAKIYDALPGFAVWDLSDEYLSSCIHENPHSEIAQACFQQYSENVLIGYTGSSGTNIPSAVQQHMSKMKALSGIEKKK